MNQLPLIDAQSRLIECDDPLILTTGGPGSGKTHAAMLLAKRLIEAEPADSGRVVLFLTFSRAATRELLTRMPTVVPASLRDRLEINTFHGYARRILDSYGRYAGRGLEPLTIASRTEQKLGLAPAGSIIMDQLVPEAVALLERSPWILERMSGRLIAVISDEYQDTGDPQDRLLTLLASRSRLLCLADGDQMIYDFLPGVNSRRLVTLRARRPTEITLEARSHRDPSGVIPRIARAIHDRRFDDAVFAEARAAGRLRIQTDVDPLYESVVAEVRELRMTGHKSVGVFVSQRFMVEELGRELSEVGIAHEIAGLDDAAGEAETVIAAMAMYATGQGDWDDVCARMAVFLAASQAKHQVPTVCERLINNREELSVALQNGLDALKRDLEGLDGQPINGLFEKADGFMLRFTWGKRLWSIGSRDLAGQAAAIVREPLSPERAQLLDAIARRRHGDSSLDEILAQPLPVRLMTTFQAKGREMDAIVLVHHPEDIMKNNEHEKLSRVHFVALSRARQTVSIMLCPNPQLFVAPYGGLGETWF
jgi:DNA helicase-2/ATP-dependent DNA helicase PcrA